MAIGFNKEDTILKVVSILNKKIGWYGHGEHPWDNIEDELIENADKSFYNVVDICCDYWIERLLRSGVINYNDIPRGFVDNTLRDVYRGLEDVSGEDLIAVARMCWNAYMDPIEVSKLIFSIIAGEICRMRWECSSKYYGYEFRYKTAQEHMIRDVIAGIKIIAESMKDKSSECSGIGITCNVVDKDKKDEYIMSEYIVPVVVFNK